MIVIFAREAGLTDDNPKYYDVHLFERVEYDGKPFAHVIFSSIDDDGAPTLESDDSYTCDIIGDTICDESMGTYIIIKTREI